MATLLDIASVSENVKVNGVEIQVFGVSAEGIVMLLQRFPEIRMLMTGKSIDSSALTELAPAAIASVISAATGTPGNLDAEAIASRLPLETQMQILEAAVRLTMPNGLGPFVQRLQDLAAMLGAKSSDEESTATGVDTKLPLPSSI